MVFLILTSVVSQRKLDKQDKRFGKKSTSDNTTHIINTSSAYIR